MDFQGRSKLLKEYQMGKTIGQGAFSKVKLGYHRETGQKVAIKVIDKKVMAEKAKKSKEAHEEREKRNNTKNVEINRSASVSKKEGDSASAVNTQYPNSDDEDQESLKEIHPVEGDVDFVSKLQLEVQLMLRLEHPNIVTVYQVIDSEDECFIIMQYASGGELIEYIASRGYLSEKEARRFFRQIISAIDHCHLANVVHRDLKLENLLLNAEKNILLSDFGLGRTFRDDLEEYMKTFCGTPNYAAVELISGIPYVGVKSDIWAMGVVLYLMVTGKPPFHGETISLLYKEIKAVNYKVYDTFSKDLRHLLSRMLCKNPAQRISMAELRQHPWVNFDEPEVPLRINPRVSGNVEPAALGQFILGMEYDKGVTSYKFHEHKKPDKPFSFSTNKPAAHKRANTVHQDNNITLTKKDTSAAMDAAAPNKSESSTEKKSTFSFFRRISVTIPESNSNKQNSSSAPHKAATSVLPPIVDAAPIPKESSITSPTVGTEKAQNSLLIPGGTQNRRHSTMGSTLTPPVPNLMMRRASDIGVDPQFLTNGQASDQKSPTQNLFSNLSAILKKSSSFIARSEASTTSTNMTSTNIAPSTVSRSPTEYGSRDSFSKSTSGAITPSAPVNRLIRSITFIGQGPGIQIPSEELQSNAASPLIPPSTSIRQIRLASHSPMVQRRESFGAKEVVSHDFDYKSSRTKAEKLLVPGAGEDMFLGKVSRGKQEISKSYHAFLSMSESDEPHQAGSEVMKSAILSNIGQQVSDSEDRLGSHDMMSLTSKFTEAATSSDQDDSTHGEMESNVEYWKELNCPAKVIRSMRFSFNQKTSSTMEPLDIFRQLTITLNKLNQQRSNIITYSRTNPDYYLLICKFRNPFSKTNDPLIFEVEVCKVWLLKIHGLRIKRIAGSPLLFKELYAFLETELRIS